MTEELYTVRQVMAKLQVCDEAIYRYIRSGKLKAVHVGGLWRIPAPALDEFLAAGGLYGTDRRRK